MYELQQTRMADTAPRTPNGDGTDPRPCHQWGDSRSGGVALCTRPRNHGGICRDRVHGQDIKNPNPRRGR